jgi:hypothetical protein
MTFSTLTPFAEAEENNVPSSTIPNAENIEAESSTTTNHAENVIGDTSTTPSVENTEETSISTPAET